MGNLFHPCVFIYLFIFFVKYFPLSPFSKGQQNDEENIQFFTFIIVFIFEIIFFSEGFENVMELAKKIVEIFKLSK